MIRALFGLSISHTRLQRGRIRCRSLLARLLRSTAYFRYGLSRPGVDHLKIAALSSRGLRNGFFCCFAAQRSGKRSD